MNLELSVVFLLTLLSQKFLSAFSSKCIVSKWRGWSACMGTCDMALRVRNRDVLRPPFPEKSADGVVRGPPECPPLYEVENCVPSECEEPESENPFSDNISLKQKYHQRKLNGKSSDARLNSTFDETKQPLKKRSKISGTGLFLNNAAQNIIQKVKCNNSQSERCCQVARKICPNGSPPKLVVRWYRQENENLCRPYNYPHCGEKYEATEKPLSSENDCVDICFTTAEKIILPTLRII